MMSANRPTIPFDDGSYTQLIIDRDGTIHENERPIKHPRSDTKTLLPPGTLIGDVHVPPDIKYEEDVEKYDQKRLEAGLAFVHTQERRNITPRTQAFLGMAKDAYKIALEEEKEKSEAANRVVQKCDEIYFSNAFFFKPREPKEFEDFNWLLRMRRLEYQVNYGNDLGEELQGMSADLKKAASAAGAHDEQAKMAAQALGPPYFWLEISERLEGLKGSVLRASVVLGVSESHLNYLISEWRDRNRVLHNQTRQFITDCHWSKLAHQLDRDIQEHAHVGCELGEGEAWKGTVDVMKGCRDQYFHYSPANNPAAWDRSDYAGQLTLEKASIQEHARVGCEPGNELKRNRERTEEVMKDCRDRYCKASPADNPDGWIASDRAFELTVEKHAAREAKKAGKK